MAAATRSESNKAIGAADNASRGNAVARLETDRQAIGWLFCALEGSYA